MNTLELDRLNAEEKVYKDSVEDWNKTTMELRRSGNTATLEYGVDASNSIPMEVIHAVGVLADHAIPKNKIDYKYREDDIIADFMAYIDKTYGQHYKTEDGKIECFDIWLSLDKATPTFRNTAIKYLWRYGKKDGPSKSDLFKAMHYVLMCLYTDFYKK